MAESNFAVTVYGDTIADLIEKLEAALDELGGDVEDDTPAPKASKSKGKAAPVEDDDDDDDDDDDGDAEDYTEADLKKLGIGPLRTIAEDEFEIEPDDLKGLKKAQVIEAILEAQDEDDDEDGDNDDEDDDDDGEDDDDDDEGYTLEELKDLDFAELKALAKEEGVSFGPRTKQASLVKAVFEVVGVDDDEDDD